MDYSPVGRAEQSKVSTPHYVIQFVENQARSDEWDPTLDRPRVRSHLVPSGRLSIATKKKVFRDCPIVVYSPPTGAHIQ